MIIIIVEIPMSTGDEEEEGEEEDDMNAAQDTIIPIELVPEYID